MAAVDVRFAQVLKQLIDIKQREWLDCDDNADRWFCHDKPFTAKERRVLMWSVGKVTTSWLWQTADELLAENWLSYDSWWNRWPSYKTRGNTQLIRFTTTFCRSCGPTSCKKQPPADVREVSDEIVQTLRDETELLDENEEIDENKENIFEILDTLLLAWMTFNSYLFC